LNRAAYRDSRGDAGPSGKGKHQFIKKNVPGIERRRKRKVSKASGNQNVHVFRRLCTPKGREDDAQVRKYVASCRWFPMESLTKGKATQGEVSNHKCSSLAAGFIIYPDR